MFKFGGKLNKNIGSLVNLLPKNGNVLDLGCGLGANSFFLSEKGFNVTCVDKDENAIDDIKKNFPNIKAVKSDILNFDYWDDKYDLILILNVLHFFNLQQAKQIIGNAIGSLNKNGLIYLQVFSINDPAFKKMSNKNLLTEEKNTFFKKETNSFMHFFEKEELIKIFSQHDILEFKEFFKKDDHPPQGKHEHYLIKMLVRK